MRSPSRLGHQEHAGHHGREGGAEQQAYPAKPVHLTLPDMFVDCGSRPRNSGRLRGITAGGGERRPLHVAPHPAGSFPIPVSLRSAGRSGAHRCSAPIHSGAPASRQEARPVVRCRVGACRAPRRAWRSGARSARSVVLATMAWLSNTAMLDEYGCHRRERGPRPSRRAQTCVRARAGAHWQPDRAASGSGPARCVASNGFIAASSSSAERHIAGGGADG